ncbi:hypothetical protein [Methylobacterium thuringiense]|uniref:Uncharacterized protein n=1 Tax=Methylobacterium thuringiense TaxID=1003091 RepID=A0ABQ4TH69_9HYPH|nr:hypothetical protein [Methylobacterium thuringiense]GJE54568.1 hypothetical protein EKPJFOCH_1046 [Methylobacterium thuringiense]
MAYPVKTAAEVRADKVAAIESINRMLERGTTEIRDAGGHMVKRDLTSLYRRRDELLAEVGSLDDVVSPQATGRIRQVRMIGLKGY